MAHRPSSAEIRGKMMVWPFSARLKQLLKEAEAWEAGEARRQAWHRAKQRAPFMKEVRRLLQGADLGSIRYVIAFLKQKEKA